MNPPTKTEVKTLRKPYLVRLEKGLMYSFPIVFIGFYFYIYWHCLEGAKYQLNTVSFWKGIMTITGIMSLSVGYALYVLFKWRKLSLTFEKDQDIKPLKIHREEFLRDEKSEDGNPAMNGFGLVVVISFIYSYYSHLLVMYEASDIPLTSFFFGKTVYLLFLGAVWFVVNLLFVHQTQEELKYLLNTYKNDPVEEVSTA